MKIIKESEKHKHFGYIYKMTMRPTGKIYVGKKESSEVDKKYYGSGRDWKIDLDIYGPESVDVEILDWADSRQELREKEVYWIAKLHAQDKSIGYNVHKGGAGGNSLGDTEAWAELHRGERNGRFGKPVSQETRDKIGNSNRGKVRSQETKDLISTSLKGKPKPDGFGDKISLARKGMPNTWNNKPVICIETGEVFNSIDAAAKAKNILGQNISRSCKTKYTAGGYHWRFKNEN